VRLSWLENACSRPLFFRRAILNREVGQTDLFLARDRDSYPCTQYYKSLCAAVAICSTLVNIQTDTLTHTQTALKPDFELKSAVQITTPTKVTLTDSRLTVNFGRLIFPWASRLQDIYPLIMHTGGATENAGVENAIRSKLQGCKMQEWTTGVENAAVSRMERQREIILRKP